MASSTATMSRTNPKFKEVLGIEAPKRLTYQEWEPGGTYIKPLTLKNVKLRTQKLKFRITSKNFFCELHPQTVMLSAGNTCTLPVSFRPIDKNEIEDKVEITTMDGCFTVPLVAVLPKPKLVVQSSLDLGLCEVQCVVHTMFSVTNSGSVPTEFLWECKPPFEITPTTGTFPSKGTLKFKASFRPCMASVYKAPAICSFGTNQFNNVSIVLEGIGKYPHLIVQEVSSVKNSINADTNNNESGDVVLSFGDISLDTTIERFIELINISPVPANFKITPEADAQMQESMFKCMKIKGTVPPNGSLKTKIVCTPDFVNQCQVGRFQLDVKGGLANPKILCKANPIGPKVVFDKECFNFGSIACGSTLFTYLYLVNHSHSTTVYQFQIDPHSVFEIDNPTGIIQGKNGVTIKITFKPLKPIPYHRAVTCLVLNQEPLVVHLIGSSYSETVKPAQLSAQNVFMYKLATLSGLSKLPPEHLLECVENESLSIADNGTLIPDQIFHPPLNELAPSPTTYSPMSNYFEHRGSWHDSQHLTVEADDMQYGYTSPHRSSEGKIVIITNNTRGTVICNWMIGRDDVFQVVPQERELLPQSSGAFAVSFWPKEHSNLFCRELECYVYYKALTNAGFAEPRLLIPPWCLTVTATGHSFSENIEPFQANITFNNKKLVLPNTLPNRPSYRSLQISSNCDTPTLFNFEHNSEHVFHIRPSYGMISGRSCQLTVVQFIPSEPHPYMQSMHCTLNNQLKFTKTLQLTGVSESPKLVVDKKENVFFKSTCVGSSSETIVTLTNPCGLPLRYVWQIKELGCKSLKIVPRGGVIQPNESLPISFLFTPQEIKRYEFTTVVSSLLLSNAAADCTSAYKHRLPLCACGEGITGEIKCLNPEIDCGHVAIGTSVKVGVTLKNSSACILKIRIGVRQLIETDNEQMKDIIEPGARPHGLEFGFSECVIQPVSEVTLPVTLRPSKTAKYTSTIFYALSNDHNSNTDPEFHDVCVISVNGVYPTLSVTDVQGEGVACFLSKSQIWSMLQVSRINHHLCEEPSPSELRYTISTRHSTSRRAPILTRAVLDVQLCPNPVDSNACSVYNLILENPGQIEAEWAFKFPMDMYMEPEFWAETGRIDPIEQHELDVVRNTLFSISPKEGTLQPSEQVVVRLVYNHSQLGTNRLPVLFKINRGREILLNLIGTTSSPDTPCITLTSTTHTFCPIPLDMQKHPIQVFEIFNAGDVEGSYSIDTAPLKDLQELNYGNSILECLTPRGILPPKETTEIEFIFSPLEAKMYSVDLAIDFNHGLTQIISFHGEGIPHHDDVTTNGLGGYKSLSSTTNLMSIPNQLVQLSQSRLVLGDIPLFAVLKSIIFMRNISDNTVSFKWNTGHNKAASVLPSTGFIQPGKAAQVKITFHSDSRPFLYNMDLICHVTNESELRKYQKTVKQCKVIEVKNSEEFIISDKKTTTKSTNAEEGEETYEDWMKKDMSKKSKTRVRKRKAQTVQIPEPPPQPQLLHLCVVANTYSIPDYCHFHGEKFDSFKIDFNSILNKEKQAKDEVDRSHDTKLSSIEMNVVKNILVECLRDLQKDTNFNASLRGIANERVPYFSQISTKKFLPPMEGDTKAKDNASRHIYAAGLEHISSLVNCVEQDGGASLSDRSDIEFEDEGSSVSMGLPKPPPPITNIRDGDLVGKRIKNSMEFQSFTDIVLENVILNVIKEANRGEVSLTAPVYTIAKPPS